MIKLIKFNETINKKKKKTNGNEKKQTLMIIILKNVIVALFFSFFAFFPMTLLGHYSDCLCVIKFSKMFIIVSMKTETCLLTSKLEIFFSSEIIQWFL